MTGLREAPEPAMYTNGSPVSRRFVGGGASGVLNSCGIAAAVAPHARGAREAQFETTLLVTSTDVETQQSLLIYLTSTGPLLQER